MDNVGRNYAEETEEVAEKEIGTLYKSWELYERYIAELLVRQSSTDVCVTVNAALQGRISKGSRQIDVLIDARHGPDTSRRIIVDAKRRGRKIDVTHVEAFRGLMEDVGATHGYMVSPLGFTAGASERAQRAVSICLLPLEHLADFDPTTWPKCQSRRCDNGRVFWDGFPELNATAVAERDAGDRKALLFVHFVGKCDRCGRFHVRCLTCDELFSLDDREGEHQCRCAPPWFWLASVEEDGDGSLIAELHVVMGMGKVATVDRRPVKGKGRAS